MNEEYYEDMLEQIAINKYLNMIANDYNGQLAKIFEEKYINKDKEIERLKEMKLHTEKYASEMEDKYILEKSKNDKAIKYIEEDIRGNYFKRYDDEVYKMCDDLLDILKGSDKE